MKDNPYSDNKNDYKTALEIDDTAKTVFAPVYPLIAEQIKSAYGIISGKCIDTGSDDAGLWININKD